MNDADSNVANENNPNNAMDEDYIQNVHNDFDTQSRSRCKPQPLLFKKKTRAKTAVRAKTTMRTMIMLRGHN